MSGCSGPRAALQWRRRAHASPPIWLRLFAVVALGFVLQENVEHIISHGHAIGLGALLGPEYPLALPVIGLVTALAGSVAAAVRRTEGALLAIISAALHRPAPGSPSGRPTQPARPAASDRRWRTRSPAALLLARSLPDTETNRPGASARARGEQAMFRRVGRIAVLCAVLTMFVSVGVALAHEERTVGDYGFVVGFLDEPVYTGQKSGLELRGQRRPSSRSRASKRRSRQRSPSASETRDLPLEPRFGEPGCVRIGLLPDRRRAVHVPHLRRHRRHRHRRVVHRQARTGFSEVQDVTGGQFPVTLPAAGDTARDAQDGAAAAGRPPRSRSSSGGAGLVAGLVALGLTLARRRP